MHCNQYMCYPLNALELVYPSHPVIVIDCTHLYIVATEFLRDWQADNMYTILYMSSVSLIHATSHSASVWLHESAMSHMSLL